MSATDPYKSPDVEVENEEEVYVPLHERLRAWLKFGLLWGNVLIGLVGVLFASSWLGEFEGWDGEMFISIAVLWTIACVVGIAFVAGLGHVRDDAERRRY